MASGPLGVMSLVLTIVSYKLSSTEDKKQDEPCVCVRES